VVGLLLHLLVVFVPVAVLAYALLAGLTLFDEGEARRVLARERARSLPRVELIPGDGVPPRIAEALRDAAAEEAKIERAIEQSKLPYGEVSAEINVLVRETGRVAQKAAVIYAYVSDPDVQEAPERLARLRRESGSRPAAADARKLALDALEAQVKIQRELEDQLERSYAELDHLVASLGVIHGQIVKMSVVEDAAVQDDLAGQVRDLRQRVTSLADGMTDAVAHVGPTS